MKFFKPFAYVIILSTLSSLFIKIFAKHENIENKEGIISLFSHYPSLMIFGLIPVVSLITWLVFKYKKFNFWEHFLIHTFLAAQINIMLVIMNLFSLSGIFHDAGLVMKLTIINGLFMSYHGFTFSSLITNNYQEKFNPIHLIKISICCLLIGSVYAYALIYTDIAKLWF